MTTSIVLVSMLLMCSIHRETIGKFVFTDNSYNIHCRKPYELSPLGLVAKCITSQKYYNGC